MTSDERWLAAAWPFVRDRLPAPPGTVVEIGCGPLGGFVPMLRSAGYDASGVDPEAPDGPWYHQMEFERFKPPGPAAAVVASASLHHVADLGEILDLAEVAVVDGGTIVVVEWAWERFDEATARWCFERLPAPSGGHEHGDAGGHGHAPSGGHDRGDQGGHEHEHSWLRHRYDDWRASGLPWESYSRAWAAGEHLHSAEDIVAALDTRFDRQFLGDGTYFFADLACVSEADEQAAIDAGEIQPGRVGYVGRKRA